MFDVGFSELMLIGVIALVVLGPEKLPKAARIAGGFLRKARRSFESLKHEVERELEAEEIKRQLASVPKPTDVIDEVLGDIRKPIVEAANSLHEAAVEHSQEMRAELSALNSTDPNQSQAEQGASGQHESRIKQPVINDPQASSNGR
jgi:sec-independent protein translocase protein TatB